MGGHAGGGFTKRACAADRRVNKYDQLPCAGRKARRRHRDGKAVMHQAIRDAGIDYFLLKTYECIDFIKKLREQENLNIFFLIYAGANVKIICKKQELGKIKTQFMSSKYHLMCF